MIPIWPFKGGIIEVSDSPITDLKIIDGKLHAIGKDFIAEIDTKNMKVQSKVTKGQAK